MRNHNIKTKCGGFTLVEMMVAIAVFSVVMVTAMSALLNVIDADAKARSIKTAINNISFALEGISKDMRMGTEYACLDNYGAVIGDGNCSGGGDGIKYRSNRADVGGDGKNKFAYYRWKGTQIEGCLEKAPVVSGICGDLDFHPITSTEVKLDKVVFYVLGVQNPVPLTNKTQPRMIMTISGTAGSANKARLQTTFDLQTSVSQRIRPE